MIHGMRTSVSKTSVSRGAVFMLIVMYMLLIGNTKVIAADEWDEALSGISKLHNNYIALQGAVKLDTQKIQQLRKENNAGLKLVNTKVQGINQELLQRLTKDVELVRKKHAPILEQYASLTKQYTAAKKAKDYKTATLLDLKRNRIKATVIAARNEIKVKTGALTAAKKNTANIVKLIKDQLISVPILKKQITAENKTLSMLQKKRSEADVSYKAAVKQGDAIAAITQMKISYSLMEEIHTAQLKIYGWEQHITRSIRAAETKLP